MRSGVAIMAACAVLALALGARAEDAKQPDMDPTLPIYKLVRSLEDVQDKIVSGDLRATEMQRFMIGMIDRRLRTASPEEFNDLRNVDAAMIYAMSGGNPATLDNLVAHDARGNFDTRLTNALLMYLGGKGGSATKSLDEIVPEYKKTAIGPYLALVAANVIMQKKPDVALQYFDWARLALPGSIVEEAALRRSLIITVKKNDIEKSIRFARLYLSRFSNSPYAAQVADQVVGFIDAHYKDIGNERISETLDWLDPPRQQELYLRVARKAAVTGRFDFAHWAAGQALALSKGKVDNPAKLAELYLSLSSVPTDADIAEMKSAFAKIPDEMLGPDERRLRDAGAFILSEVERPATLESLTQAPPATNAKQNAKPDGHNAADAPHGGAAEAKPGEGKPADAKQAETKPAETKSAPGGAEAKPAAAKPGEAKPQAAAAESKDGIDTFVTDGRAQLQAIDELMKKGDK